MNISELSVAPDPQTVARLEVFESQFSYPLGETSRFRISHLSESLFPDNRLRGFSGGEHFGKDLFGDFAAEGVIFNQSNQGSELSWRNRRFNRESFFIKKPQKFTQDPVGGEFGAYFFISTLLVIFRQFFILNQTERIRLGNPVFFKDRKSVV